MKLSTTSQQATLLLISLLIIDSTSEPAHTPCFIPLPELALPIFDSDPFNAMDLPTSTSHVDSSTTRTDKKLAPNGQTSNTAPSSSLRDEANTAMCTPYCSAIDDEGRCTAITGCGYPADPSGRSACRTTGFYTGLEMAGLLVILALVTVILMGR